MQSFWQSPEELGATTTISFANILTEPPRPRTPLHAEWWLGQGDGEEIYQFIVGSREFAQKVPVPATSHRIVLQDLVERLAELERNAELARPIVRLARNGAALAIQRWWLERKYAPGSGWAFRRANDQWNRNCSHKAMKMKQDRPATHF
jgi:hypothetical protein